MAAYPSPLIELIPALVIDLCLAALFRPKQGPRGPKTLLVLAIASAVLLGAGAWFGFVGPARAWPIWLGLALGALQAIVWGWLWPAPEDQPRTIAPAATGVAVLAVLGLAFGDAVTFANAALGFVLAWAVPVLAQALMQLEAPALAAPDAIALGLVATAAGAASWGEKLAPHAGLGVPFAVGLASRTLIALAVMGWVSRSKTGGPATATPTAIVAGLVVFWGSSGILLIDYTQPWLLGLAIALGGALGLGLPLVVDREGRLNSAGALLALALAGGLLVLDNRLGGIFAIGVGGLGLVLAARPGQRSAGFAGTLGLLMAIEAARVWLQLLLDRTNLTGYGVDLTHPYAFAALVVGAFGVPAAGAIARLFGQARAAIAVWAFLLVLLPVWFGYFVHVEALGALIAGGIAGAFAVGVGLGDRSLTAVAGPWLLATTSGALLGAPWLVGVMNAPRGTRAVALVVGVVVLAAIAFWARRRVLVQAAATP